MSVEKSQGKGLLYPCPKCPLAEDLWYTHFPSPYGCCHYGGLQGGQYYHQEPCSPCPAHGQTSAHEKSKGCKVKFQDTACVHEYICVTSSSLSHTRPCKLCPINRLHPLVSFVTSILHTAVGSE